MRQLSRLDTIRYRVGNPLKLILNAEALRPPITGIGNYTFHLLEQYLTNNLMEEVHCFSSAGWLDGEEQLAITADIKARAGNNDKQRADITATKIRNFAGAIPGIEALYGYLMDKRFEHKAGQFSGAVYHEPRYILKPYAGPCVTTVHDLTHIRYPHFHDKKIVQWLGEKLPPSLDRADCIVTDSDVVRNELLEYFNVPQEKVRTVYLGAEECYQPRSKEQTSDVLSNFGLTHKQYVLLVATLEPRKQIDVLLDAWCLLPESLRRVTPLVLAGSFGWRNESLVKRISSLVAEGTVKYLGYVPAETLPILFSGAAVFTYPSVYEGFGLPVLDAMSSGVPVICRAGTSMDEFSEGACVLCETGDPEELALKLESLLESQEKRDVWAQKGLTQAAQFSWERCAAETAEIYRMVS